jgi:hypothetical protein
MNILTIQYIAVGVLLIIGYTLAIILTKVINQKNKETDEYNRIKKEGHNRKKHEQK